MPPPTIGVSGELSTSAARGLDATRALELAVPPAPSVVALGVAVDAPELRVALVAWPTAVVEVAGAGTGAVWSPLGAACGVRLLAAGPTDSLVELAVCAVLGAGADEPAGDVLDELGLPGAVGLFDWPSPLPGGVEEVVEGVTDGDGDAEARSAALSAALAAAAVAWSDATEGSAVGRPTDGVGWDTAMAPPAIAQSTPRRALVLQGVRLGLSLTRPRSRLGELPLQDREPVLSEHVPWRVTRALNSKRDAVRRPS